MDKEHVVRLLKGPISTWNQWRRSSPGVIPNLLGADLRDADLRDADLSEADLREADLRGADLSEADLRGARLTGARLTGALLTDADLSEADLVSADLICANLRDADLREADLREAGLRGAYLYKADLVGADLTGADLRGAYLHGADLRGANLTGAILIRARLHGADLSEADLTEAYTREADLTAATDDSRRRIVKVTLTVNLPTGQSPADLAAVLGGVASLVEASQRVSSRPDPLNDPDTSSPGAVRTMTGDASGIEVEVRTLRYGSPFVISLVENWEPFVVLVLGGYAVRDVLKGLEQSALINILLVVAEPSIREAFFEERREYYANKKKDRTTPAPTLRVPPMTLDEAAANLEQSVPDANERLHVIEALAALEALLSRGIVATEEPDASPPDVVEINDR